MIDIVEPDAENILARQRNGGEQIDIGQRDCGADWKITRPSFEHLRHLGDGRVPRITVSVHSVMVSGTPS